MRKELAPTKQIITLYMLCRIQFNSISNKSYVVEAFKDQNSSCNNVS